LPCAHNPRAIAGTVFAFWAIYSFDESLLAEFGNQMQYARCELWAIFAHAFRVLRI